MSASASARSRKLAGGPDEGPPRDVLLVAGLLAHEHDARARRALAEHGLRRIAIRRAARAVRRFGDHGFERSCAFVHHIPKTASPRCRFLAALGRARTCDIHRMGRDMIPRRARAQSG
jgi:hypothetical protein